MTNSQKEICQKYGSDFVPVSENEMIVVAGKPENFPIFGSRISDWDEKGEEYGLWVISFADAQEDEEELWNFADFQQKFPQVVPFLGLEIGFNFVLESADEVDVWREEFS